MAAFFFGDGLLALPNLDPVPIFLAPDEVRGFQLGMRIMFISPLALGPPQNNRDRCQSSAAAAAKA